MSKFDTHGGYFAPKDYMKVEEGGSHEENPNGGVQIGVDPEGTPNLLEEGEPVYKDYVYSDNIEADEKFLEENHIPKKYAGKLYSKIAEDYVSEAEERPLDPISRSGLEAMLSRLAEAQESQKQAEEQRKLEEELANLSPEELDQLEAMLAQGGEDLGEAPGEMGPEQMGPAMPLGQMPMMAQGGFLRRFDFGGSIDEPVKTPEQIMLEAQQARQMRQRMMEEQAAAEKAESSRKAQESMIRRYQRQLERNQKALERLTRNAEKVYPADVASYKTLLKKQQDLVSYSQKRLDDARASYNKTYSVSGVPADTLLQVPYGIGSPGDSLDIEFNGEPQGSVAGKKPVQKGNINNYVLEWRRGGQMNRFDGGGWADFLDLVRGYTPSSRAGGIDGTYSIDPNFAYLNGFKDIYALEESDPYKAFTEYVKNNATDPQVLEYLRLLDKNTGGTADKLFLDENTLRDNWSELYDKRRGDHIAGIYHLNPADIAFLSAQAALPEAAPGEPASEQAVAQRRSPGAPTPWYQMPIQDNLSTWRYKQRTGQGFNPNDYPIEVPPVENPFARSQEYTLFPGQKLGVTAPKSFDSSTDTTWQGEPMPLLPTWPRYAGAVGSGLLGLYNVFQQPDKYTDTKMPVFTPEGRINLQNQIYRPIDQNMVANAQIAQGNATQRALRNSGLGPSTAASVLAADNNLTGNLGTGFIQAWDANNQRRNAVIAANNQAEGQRAQFDANMDYYRAAMLNNWAARRAQNDLMIQRLNNAAEGEKYTAISNQLDNGLQALSGIGKENFSMNQINTNPYFMGYNVGPNGGIYYYNPETKRIELIDKKKGGN